MDSVIPARTADESKQNDADVQTFEITKVKPKPMGYLMLSLLAIGVIGVVLMVANVITLPAFATLLGMLFLSAFAGMNIIRSNYTVQVQLELYSDRIMPGGVGTPIYLNQIKNYSIIYSANHVQLKLTMNDGKVRALGADLNKGFESFIPAFESRIKALDAKENLAITRKPSFVETRGGLAFLIIFTIFYIGCTIGCYYRWGNMPLRLWMYYIILVGMWIARYRALGRIF